MIVFHACGRHKYKVRLRRKVAALLRRQTARGGGWLCSLYEFGDILVDEMYINIAVQRMDE